MPYFAVGRPRQVSAAQQIRYPAPCLHPDRVMGEHDLIYLLEGSWEIWEENAAYLLQPGDVLILPAGRHHYGRRPCQAGTRTLFVHMEALPGDGATGADPLGLTLPCRIDCRHAPAAADCFRQLEDAFWSDRPSRERRLAALAELLLCVLHDAACSQGKNLLVERAKAALRQDPQGRLTLDALAERLEVTPRRLRYLFRREVGTPLHRYHRNLRLDMAMQMLRRGPERSMRELAEAYGFCDEFHFSRAFRQRFGIPPSGVLRQGQGRP